MGSGMIRIWAGSETPGFGGFERQMRWDFSIGSVYGREVVLVFDGSQQDVILWVI